LPERIEFIDMPELLRPKYQYSTQARIDRLRACGYTAPVSALADAVRDYVSHYLEPGRVLDPAQHEALSLR
jgi:ADP-L-glycero-D-manno-heptose 6-epimerase